MLLPSLACQARCAYCFGPNRGPAMSPQVFDAALDWLAATTPAPQRLGLTFHGGEPLLVGRAWYERTLPLLRGRFGDQLSLGMQSNLWLLDDPTCALLKECGVALGASLDGPEALNDAQRGESYFARTMAGIETAHRHGMDVGVICTFTRRSAPHYREIFDFFARAGLAFSVHEAVCTLGNAPDDALSLSPSEHATLFTALFDYYLAHIAQARISTFDAMARGISAGEGGICTFCDCLGDYLAIAPDGGIYSCNRFAHHPEWRLGFVQETPTLETLAQSPAWQRLRQRELQVHQDCGDCPHFNYCRGGCAYNAVAAGTDRRDPHCLAYRQVFSHITDRALTEVFADENLEAVVREGMDGRGLLRKGTLLQVMRGGPHPQKVAARAREMAAAVALAVSPTPEEALHKLDRAGLITRPDLALGSLAALRNRLDGQSREGLLNAYLHVTYTCNLACTHCYASAGPGQTGPTMTVDDATRLVRAAAAAGFRKAIITGGEPLAHPQRDALLEALSALRQEVKPLQTVLRTNLAYPLHPALLERLAYSTDQVVVSLDGDEVAHDARRGAGTWARTVPNLRTLLAESPSTAVSITAVLPAAQVGGPAGEAVRKLGQELGISVRFKPVLPLGRAAASGLVPPSGLAAEFYSSLDDDGAQALVQSPRPVATCGLGMNLYIAPDGDCFPCYALMGERHRLGNALDGGLTEALKRNDAYRAVTVDSNQQCRSCALRYLCGGFCRAWGVSDDPDAPPGDCAGLYERARKLLLDALNALGVSQERRSALVF